MSQYNRSANLTTSRVQMFRIDSGSFRMCRLSEDVLLTSDQTRFRLVLEGSRKLCILWFHLEDLLEIQSSIIKFPRLNKITDLLSWSESTSLLSVLETWTAPSPADPGILGTGLRGSRQSESQPANHDAWLSSGLHCIQSRPVINLL